MEWTASGAEAAFKHLSRVHRIASETAESDDIPANAEDETLLREMHKAIHDVTGGVESFGFQRLDRQALCLYQHTGQIQGRHRQPRREAAKTLAQLMSPMTPHLSEELWQLLGR